MPVSQRGEDYEPPQRTIVEPRAFTASAPAVEVSTERGVDPEIEVNNGDIAPVRARQSGRPLDHIETKRASRDDQGRTALMCAAARGPTMKLGLLLGRGAAVNEKDANGRTALIFAAVFGNIANANMLLRAGANVHETDGAGRTAPMLAASKGYADLADLLIRHGARVNQKEPRGMSALMFAVINHTAVIERLVASGAGLRDKDREGRSALTLAAATAHAGAVIGLLDAGSDINEADEHG